MLEVFSVIKDSSTPSLLVGGGILFLVLAIAGRIMGQIEVLPQQQRWAGLIGILLLVSGIAIQIAPTLHVQPSHTSPTNEPMPTTQSASIATEILPSSTTPTIVPTLQPATALPATAFIQDDPVSSLRAYWQAVSSQHYSDAWPMLSPNFRWTTHANDFDAYVQGYMDQGLCDVSPQEIVVVSNASDYARIDAMMLYHKGPACAASPLGLIFHMIPAADRPSWLIDRVELQ